MKLATLLVPACALGALAFARSSADRLVCAPHAPDGLSLESSLDLRTEFTGCTVKTAGLEWAPEDVFQGFDAGALAGERSVAAELRLVPLGAEERSLWLEAVEVDGEDLDGVGALEAGQGVRFRRAEGSWFGTGIDAAGEPLDVPAEGALSALALFGALLPGGDVEPGDAWKVELGSAEAAGLLLPGLGFELLPALVPANLELVLLPERDTREVDLGEALRAQAPELFAGAGGALEVTCRYVGRDGDLARLEYTAAGTLTVDLGAPLTNAIQGDEGPGEATSTVEIELMLDGSLVWSLVEARPVRHGLEGSFATHLTAEATSLYDWDNVPLTAEFDWTGHLAAAAVLE